MVEVHFGVPLCGAVLNALNYRLDAEAIAFSRRDGDDPSFRFFPPEGEIG